MENLMKTQNPESITQAGETDSSPSKNNKPRKMTLSAFGPWIEEKCGAEYLLHGERVDCVASIGHIEPGHFAALYAIPSPEGLEIFELTDYYPNQAEAWEALQSNADTYPPELFEDWVKQQYITDKSATVERLAF